MRNLNELNHWRVMSGPHLDPYEGYAGDETCGVFLVPLGPLVTMKAIVSCGEGWDHVSVGVYENVKNHGNLPRIATWEEMQYAHRLFFKPDETAMELHVPKSDHVNNATHVLHLWRPNDGREIPRPPKEFV